MDGRGGGRGGGREARLPPDGFPLRARIRKTMCSMEIDEQTYPGEPPVFKAVAVTIS